MHVTAWVYVFASEPGRAFVAGRAGPGRSLFPPHCFQRASDDGWVGVGPTEKEVRGCLWEPKV